MDEVEWNLIFSKFLSFSSSILGMILQKLILSERVVLER